jgi:sporulation protein YlmC with PRC-barrel domain
VDAQVMLMTVIWVIQQHQNGNNVGQTNDLILDLKKKTIKKMVLFIFKI